MKIYIYENKEGIIGYDFNGQFYALQFYQGSRFNLKKNWQIDWDKKLGIIVMEKGNDKLIVYQLIPPTPEVAEVPPPQPEILIAFNLVFVDKKGWFLKAPNGQLYPFQWPQQESSTGGAAAGGGGSGKGIKVQDEGTQIGGIMKTLNFIGELVTVTDAGGQKANITIKIPSMTTAARLALVPATALIVEDTDLDMYFKWSTVTNSWNPF